MLDVLRRTGSALLLCPALTLAPPLATAQAAPPASPDTGPEAGTKTAPDTGPNTGPIENIVVTGTKRDTSVHDAPMGVTVLDALTIQDARLRDFRRLDDLVPNVKFNETGQMSSIFISIRGVESNPFVVNRAAVYIDGIPFRELNNAVLNQVDSIEVLRGPQGTLYGANSESGLVIVRTRAPGDETTGTLRLTGTAYSAGFGIEGDGFIAGPMVEDVLSGSLSFKVGREDAYMRNKASSIGREGLLREAFVQGRVRFTPTDRLTVDATGYLIDLMAPGLFSQEYVALDIDRYNALYADSLNGGRRMTRFTMLHDAPKRSTEREIVAGLNATYALDYGQIDTAVSYRHLETDNRGLDFDSTAAAFVAGSEAKNERYWNAEIRFTSPEHDRGDYIVGASLYDEYEDRYLATLLGPGGLDDYVAAPTQKGDGRDYAVFASGRYRPGFLPDLTIGAGIRYDRAKRGTVQTPGELDMGGGTVIAYPEAVLSEPFDAVLPKGSISYAIGDAWSVYASGAKGYIPGGFNLAAVQDGFTDPNALRYGAESLWSREVGAKWRSPDRTLRFSGALFYITSDNWQELQVATDDQGRPISSDYIGSSASIRSQGFEIEGHWAPTEALTLNGHLGYVDAEYRDLQVDPETNLRGQAVKFVPAYDGLLAARYQWPVGVFARVEAVFTGDMPLEARGEGEQPAVVTLGAQLGLERAWGSVRLFAENLTNRRRASGLALRNLAFGNDGLFYAPIEAPRIVGLELEGRF
ncbi:hypothetical protein CCR85_12835 [Rhodothalassium salexigens]|nr:hypothetical protein [Rhodothalassium salexigens]